MGQIKFLNADLDIESNIDISLLVKEISTKATVFRHEYKAGVHFASLETYECETEENVIISEYKSIVTSFSSEAKAQWESCHKKIFDFGYSGGNKPKNFYSNISKESIAAIAELGAEMVITIYPMERNIYKEIFLFLSKLVIKTLTTLTRSTKK